VPTNRVDEAECTTPMPFYYLFLCALILGVSFGPNRMDSF